VETPACRELGYRLVPAIFIVTSVWMLFYTAALRPRESFLGLLTMLAGGLAYRWIRRQRRDVPRLTVPG